MSVEKIAGELEVWYDQQPATDYSDGEPAIILRTVEDLDAFVDRVVDETKDHRCPAMIEVSIKGQQLPVLEVGIGQARGFITYHAEKGGSTKGDGDSSVYVEYVYAGNLSEIPADSEVPLEQVRQGLREFIETGGRPAVVKN